MQITRFGGPEVLEVVDLPDPVPGRWLVLLEVTAAGVNYADTHQTEDTYLARQTLPLVPGAEVVGRTPDGAARRRAPRRAVATPSRRSPTPRFTFAVPDAVSDCAALAVVLQGTTAWHLLRTAPTSSPASRVVVHAGAGGVGTLAVQLAKALGRRSGHRDGLDRGQARAHARARCRRRRRAGRRGPRGPAPRGERRRAGRRRARDDRRRRLRREPARAGSVRPSRDLRPGVASGADPRRPSGELMAKSRAVIGFWLAHCFAPPGDAPHRHGRPARPRSPTARCGRSRAASTPSSRPRRAHEALLSRRTTGKLVLDPTLSPTPTPGAE